MSLSLNITVASEANDAFTYKVAAPCKGSEAIEQGRQAIMERLGTAAEFVSYQEGKQKPARVLQPNELVLRDSFLHFSASLGPIMAMLRQHNKLLTSLYRDKMDDTLTLYASRFLKASTSQDDIEDKGKIQKHISADSSLAQALAQTLSQLGAQQVSPADIAVALDGAFYGKNCRVHANSDAVLFDKMQDLATSGATELLATERHVACLIVKNYEAFLKLLPGYQAG